MRIAHPAVAFHGPSSLNIVVAPLYVRLSKQARAMGRPELKGKPMHVDGVPGTHLQRFHRDPAEFLGAYGVFHGDDRQPGGEPLPTGSLRRSQNPLGSTGGSVYHTFGGGPPAAYTIRPTMTLQSLTKDRATTKSKDGTGLLGSTTRSGQPLSATGALYEYATGTFHSTSALPACCTGG